jgi:hypothetical protein
MGAYISDGASIRINTVPRNHATTGTENGSQVRQSSYLLPSPPCDRRQALDKMDLRRNFLTLHFRVRCIRVAFAFVKATLVGLFGTISGGTPGLWSRPRQRPIIVALLTSLPCLFSEGYFGRILFAFAHHGRRRRTRHKYSSLFVSHCKQVGALGTGCANNHTA